ncbi:MAG: toxin-antitoxin system HicB family antitoxin [Polyangia bacterium]
MTTKNDAPMIEQLCSRHYPVEIHHVAEEGAPGYYLAFLPDFGESTCSATGDTMTEAIERLSDVKREILQHFLDTGRDIPDPSKGPHDAPVLQQMPLRLPKDIHDRLKQRAEHSGMSLNAYATRVFVEHLTMISMEAQAEALFQKLTMKLTSRLGWEPAEPVWRTEGMSFVEFPDIKGFRPVGKTVPVVLYASKSNSFDTPLEGLTTSPGLAQCPKWEGRQ